MKGGVKMRMGFKLKNDIFRQAILQNDMRLTDIAKTTELSSATISKIVSGKQCKAKTANKIAKALNVPVTDLFE